LLRQAPMGIHPNWWGELMLCFVFGALAFERALLRYALLLVACILIVLVQSRGAMLAIGFGLVVYFSLSRVGNLELRSKSVAFLLIALSLMVSLAIFPAIGDLGIGFVMDNVLLVTDPQRGIGTGLTGRLEGWDHALSVFDENVFIGNGLDTLLTVHNGMIRVAGENGIVFLALLILLVLRALSQSNRQGNRWRFAAIAAYMVYAVTYPRMLNMNLAAVLFFVCLFSWQTGSMEYSRGQRQRLS